MSSAYAFANISDIEELLLFYDTLINDGHIISVVNIKNMLKLPTDLSQKFLQYYFEQRKEQLTVTYLIEGYNKKDNEHICAILSEKEISDADVAGIENYTVKIYTVQSKKSRVHPTSLWRQEMNELIRTCKKDFKKEEIFIPQFSDFILNDLEIKKKETLFDKSDHCKQTDDSEKSNEKKTLIKIKTEKTSEDEKQTNQAQTNKTGKNNEYKVATETFIKTSNEKSIYDFANLIQKKKKSTNDVEISKKIKREILTPQDKSVTCISLDENCDKSETGKDHNLTNYFNIPTNENESATGVQENITGSGANEGLQNLFHSDSSSNEEVEKNANTSEENIEDVHVHVNVEKEVTETNKLEKVKEPSRNKQRIQSVKETKMYFENGYLVTTENDSCVYVNDSYSSSKTQSMEHTVLTSPVKKKRAPSQQTLLTSFFKKKK